MVDGPVTKRRFKRRTVRNAIIGGVVVIVISVVVGVGWKVFSSVSQSADKAVVEAMEETTRELASQAASRYQSIVKPLKDLTDNEEILALFEQGDQTLLDQAAMENEAAIPGVIKLRFLMPGAYALDQESKPPLGYASLDLLRKAEKTSQTNADVLMLGKPDEHIVVIERVDNKALQLVGLIHASMSVDILKEMTKGISLEKGYMEITQSSGGRVLTLANVGDKSMKGGQSTTASIRDTGWVVQYWASESAVSSDASSTGGLPIIPIGAVIVFLLIAVFFFMKKKGGSDDSPDKVKKTKTKTKKTKTVDHVTYEGAVRAIVEGAHEGVSKWIPHLPKGKKTASEAKPVSQGMAGDDITTMAKPPVKKPAKPAPTKSAAATESKQNPEASPEPAPAADAEAPAATEAKPATAIDPVIFRTYDIRGVVGETLTKEAVSQIARALGSMAIERGQKTFAVGRDGRQSGPEFAEALIEGLKSTGCDVIDVGMVPSPVLYFATYQLKTGSGVMVTGSHNPPEYNGLKMMLGGDTLSGDDIQEIRQRVEKGEFASGNGKVSNEDVNADYIRRITDDIPVALGNSLKIVVDCGNGVAGVLAPQLLKALNHDIIEMYCEIDGRFPNHHPDPSQPENMQELIERVKSENADVGFAFDGDGDRLGIVDANGNIIWPDRQMMMLAKDVLSRNAGASIIYDVKCSRYLKTVIEENGGKPLMWKTGHSLIKSKMREVEAPLAGEMSGHIFFKERWYGFDDALYTAARFIEIFVNSGKKPTELFDELPGGVSTPELRMEMPESEHGSFMSALIQTMEDSAGGEVSDIDGVRIEYEDGWGLARPSNTSPNIILRFEGEDEAALERIKTVFKEAVLTVKADASLPF